MSDAAQTVAETVEAIADGHLTARQWTEHCLSQVDSPEPIGAWSYLDRDRALERADDMDWLRKDGSALGALHGCPIGQSGHFSLMGLTTGRVSNVSPMRSVRMSKIFRNL